ncbi:AraC family transcriptional regulator [Bradyrhizobium manausense]|uniref:AraC family transcriptional regulator n=1 Tax=Bradyrhizobium manausense TaxID=989370 RepID=UPI001BAC4F0F|nr:AraC family transcriptional regulator [Bradyrhizobium manausense]MBR1090720.1 AraC family transcriptional regulator [Bradyrhizobium manausense]
MPTAPSNRELFRTDGFPEQDRFDIFRDEIIRRNGSLDVARRGIGTFRAELHRQAVGPIVVGSIIASPLDLFRTQNMLADSNDSFVIHMCRSGRPVSTQRDEAIRLAPGDAVICDWRNTGSFRLDSETHFSSINIPRPVLSKRLRRLPNGGSLLSGDDTARRLLFSYIDTARALPLSDGSRAAELYGEHVLDLAALALGAEGETREIAEQRGARAARRAAILRIISQQFGDPGLDPAAVAAQLGITPRYLHMLLEETGCSFTQHLLDKRLEQAAVLLRDPRQHGWKISAIAQEAGFADLSYFNRAFRRRFGDTPSGVRAAAGQRLQNER